MFFNFIHVLEFMETVKIFHHWVFGHTLFPDVSHKLVELVTRRKFALHNPGARIMEYRQVFCGAYGYPIGSMHDIHICTPTPTIHTTK